MSCENTCTQKSDKNNGLGHAIKEANYAIEARIKDVLVGSSHIPVLIGSYVAK